MLEGERDRVAQAFLDAEKAGEEIVKTRAKEAENGARELALLAEECRVLLSRLVKKYPDEDDVRDFNAFCETLYEKLRVRDGEDFDMQEVLSPKEPLDLESLCRGLGLMDDGEEVCRRGNFN